MHHNEIGERDGFGCPFLRLDLAEVGKDVRVRRMTGGRWLAWLLLLACGCFGQGAAESRQDVKTDAFSGRLYVPAGVPKRVAVVVIGGSEGHLYQADDVGPQLAAAGYTTLGVDYHSGYDPGRKLDRVPIETFTSAVSWLKSSPGKPDAVVVMGDSRGSEAAFLTGIYSREVAGVAAFVPSSLLWGATDNAPSIHHAAWMWAGKALACEDCERTGTIPQMLEATGRDDPARIEVERVTAPVFLAGSDADAVWPSGQMAREVAERLGRAHFAYPVTLLTFPEASHHMWGTGPKNPVESYSFQGKTFTSNAGGTAAGTQLARNESWAAMLVFLESIVPVK